MSSPAKVVPIKCARRSCDECALIGQCLARNVDTPDDRRFDVPVVPRIYRRGDHLFRCGEEFEAIYMVRSGAIKTYLICPNGDTQLIGFHTPGDIIGLDAIDSGRYACHAEVLDASSVCAFPFDKLSRLCAHSKTVYERLMRGISRKIQRDASLLLLLGQKSAEQRMAAFLLDIAAAHSRQGFSSSDFNLLMTRADIGSYLALAVETVSRILTRLQAAGILSVQRNRIRILDHDALTGLAAEPAQEYSVMPRSRAAAAR